MNAADKAASSDFTPGQLPRAGWRRLHELHRSALLKAGITSHIHPGGVQPTQ